MKPEEFIELEKEQAIMEAEEEIEQLKCQIEAKDARIAELEGEIKFLDASVAVGLDNLTQNAKAATAALNEAGEFLKYVKRLEEAFLKVYRQIMADSSPFLDEANTAIYVDREARAALELIKEWKG